MPRKPREFQIGNIYHIINRGVEKRLIFEKPQDYSRFILGLELFNRKESINLWPIISRAGTDLTQAERLREIRKESRKRIVDLLAFVSMPNHFHLILKEIVPGGISLFMKKIGGYALYFNKQYDRVGPLFQSRYKATLIKNDSQLATVFAYVHTNPVELFDSGWKNFQVKDPEKVIAKLEDYRWSSYRDYIGLPTFPSVTQRDFFLRFFGGKQACQKEIEIWIRYKASQTQLGPEIIE